MNGRSWWALASLTWALPLSAQGGGLAYEGGLGFFTGRYFFDTRTTSLSLSSGLAYTAGRLTLRVALPVVAQNTPLVTASGAGGLPSGGPFGGMVADSGGQHGMRRRGLPVGATARRDYAAAVGDPVAQAAVQVIAGPEFTLRAGAAVKAPLADTATYGTGRWDAGLSLGATGYFGSAVFVSVDAAWWHLGDLPALDFRDPFVGSLSVDRMLGRWSLGVVASAATSAITGYEAPASIGMALSRVTTRGGWGISAMAGLTESAPELAVGVTWRLRL